MKNEKDQAGIEAGKTLALMLRNLIAHIGIKQPDAHSNRMVEALQERITPELHELTPCQLTRIAEAYAEREFLPDEARTFLHVVQARLALVLRLPARRPRPATSTSIPAGK